MSAAWLLPYSPLAPLFRTRIALPFSAHVKRYLPVNLRASKTFFNSSLLTQEHPSMIEMRNAPYPSLGWDTSLFEDAEESTEAIDVHDIRSRPCNILVRTVEAEQFEEAHTLRAELENMGVVIQPDSIYERIAVHEAFSKNIYDGDIPAFLSWWSLVPELQKDHPLRRKSDSLSAPLLSQCSDPDAYTLVSSALHATFRGHGQTVSRLFVKRITAASTTAFVKTFLRDLCVAQLAHLQTISDGKELPRQLSEHCATFYGRAIKTMCYSRREVDAAKLLIEADETKIALPDGILRTLQTHLHKVADRRLTRIVKRIAIRQGVDVDYAPPEETTFQSHELYSAFGELKKTLDAGRLPSIADLRRYIVSCYSTDNYQALAALREAYHRSLPSDAAIARWAAEEMRYFMGVGQKHAVLAVFAKYFLPIGVPDAGVANNVKAAFRKAKRDAFRATEASEDDMFTAPSSANAQSQLNSRAEGFVPQHLTVLDSTPAQKIAPTRFHTVYVWQALCRIATVRRLPWLYTEFVRVVEHAKSTGLTSSPSLLPPGVDTALFDSVHFNVFIRAFGLRRLQKQAYHVLQDMERLEVKPDLETYTTLLRALRANPTLMDNVVRHAELTVPMYKAGRGITWTFDAHSNPDMGLLVLYTAALNLAVDYGQHEIARRFEKRILRSAKYKEGVNRIVDRALKRFQAAKSLGPQERNTLLTPHSRRRTRNRNPQTT
ncbi:hypothetical protein BDW22DRAFT_779176 [Trametopsis cervina]|nr:hypothetical protein BDW22DRAFT_779176 [Trametopsis cervina]